MIYVLAALLFLLLVATYFGVGQDLMHPSVLTVGAMLLCVCASMYNIKLWNMQYHANTVIIVIFGMSCVSLMGIICARCKSKRKKYSLEDAEIVSQNGVYKVDKTVYGIVVCFDVLVLSWYYYIVLKTTGGGALTEMLHSFRMIHSYGVGADDAASIPGILNQCIKVNKVLAYLFVMIFLNNAIGYKKKDWKYLVPPLLFCIQTLLGSDRIYIILLAGSSVVMAYVIWHRKNGWQKNISGKYVKVAAKALMAILIFFVLAGNLIGHSSEKIADPLEYISSYMGGSIQLLDMYVQEPLHETDSGWGEETFSSVYKTVVQMQGNTPPKRHMEFRASNGVIIGNIYTALRKYYHDFGFSGVVILCSIFGLFYGIAYKRLQQERITELMSYKLCAYCFIVHCTFYFPLDDLFFSGVISINYFSMLIYMYVIYYFLIKRPIRFSW